MTDDPDEAREWLSKYRAAGIEGLVVKGASSRYLPGKRGWVKVKHRATVEVIVGAVIGSVRRPHVLVVGRYTGPQLRILGRTVPLNAEQSGDLARLLTSTVADHPWPNAIASGRWGGASPSLSIGVHAAPRGNDPMRWLAVFRVAGYTGLIRKD